MNATPFSPLPNIRREDICISNKLAFNERQFDRVARPHPLFFLRGPNLENAATNYFDRLFDEIYAETADLKTRLLYESTGRTDKLINTSVSPQDYPVFVEDAQVWSQSKKASEGTLKKRLIAASENSIETLETLDFFGFQQKKKVRNVRSDDCQQAATNAQIYMAH